MAAELGIGVRVRTGWSPDNEVLWVDSQLDPRLREGVIVDGPTYRNGCLCWLVDFGVGPMWDIDEPFLIPIDDDNDQITRDERELVEERM